MEGKIDELLKYYRGQLKKYNKMLIEAGYHQGKATDRRIVRMKSKEELIENLLNV